MLFVSETTSAVPNWIVSWSLVRRTLSELSKLYYHRGGCGSGNTAAGAAEDGDDAVSMVEQLLGRGFRAEAAAAPALGDSAMDRGDFMPPQAASAAPVLLLNDMGMGGASDNSR